MNQIRNEINDIELKQIIKTNNINKLKEKININNNLIKYINENNDNLALLCCRYNNLEILHYLVEYLENLDVDEIRNEKMKEMNKNKIIKFLNKINLQSWTCLMFACMHENKDMVQFLMNYNISAEVVNNEYMTCLDYCTNELIEVIYMNKLKYDEYRCDITYDACLRSNEALEIVAKFVDIDNVDTDGDNALMMCCNSGSFEGCQRLINMNSNVNFYGMNGTTPLLLACKNGNVNIVKLLIDSGAEVNHVNDSGDSPFILGCWYGRYNVIKLLLQNGVDVYHQDSEGNDGLRYLFERNWTRCIELLLCWGIAHDLEICIRCREYCVNNIQDKSDTFGYGGGFGYENGINGKYKLISDKIETIMKWFDVSYENDDDERTTIYDTDTNNQTKNQNENINQNNETNNNTSTDQNLNDLIIRGDFQFIITNTLNTNSTIFDETEETKIGGDEIFTDYKGKYLYNKVVIKKMNNIINNKYFFIELLYEAYILKQIYHPNLAQFYGIGHFNNSFVVINEYLEQRDLKQYLQSNNMNITQKISLIFDVAKGVHALHEANITHKNIMAKNIFLEYYVNNNKIELRAKVANFGLDRTKRLLKLNILNNLSETTPDYVRYYAPESFEKEKHINKYSDIYSFGMFIWEVFGNCKFKPYHYIDRKYEIKKKIVSYELERIPDECPSEVKDIILSCWQRNGLNRPKSNEICDLLEQLIMR